MAALYARQTPGQTGQSGAARREGGQLQQSHVKIHTVIMWQTKTIDKRPKARSGGGRSGGGGMAGYGTSLNRRRGAFPPVSQPATPPALPSKRRLLIFHTCSPTTRKAKRAKEKRKKRARNLSNNFSCVPRVCVCCVCVFGCVLCVFVVLFFQHFCCL